MALIRWNPFGELDRFFNGGLRHEIEDCSCDWAPSVDIFDGDNEIVLTAELPGLSQEDVKVNIENNVLTLSGERKIENEETRDNYSRVERYYGSFSRSFRLPNTVDQANIDAGMEKGVLRVTLPKSEQTKPKQIEVKVN